MRAFDDGFRRAALATALCLAAAAVAAADHESSPTPESSTQPPSDPPSHFFPRATDVTAVATYALAVDADTSAGGPRAGTHVAVTALGSNSVPATVHFASHCGAETFYEGGATLPVDVGPVRSAAAWDGDVALGTAQAPGVVVAAGALTPGVVTLRPGEDVLAAATAGPGPTFLFATWTAPSVVVKLQKDERTGGLVRRGAITLPLGVDYVRAAASRTDASTGRAGLSRRTRRRRWWRDSRRRPSLASAAVARGADVRAGATVPDGTAILDHAHVAVQGGQDGSRRDATRQLASLELDAALGENAAASAVTDERGLSTWGSSGGGAVRGRVRLRGRVVRGRVQTREDRFSRRGRRDRADRRSRARRGGPVRHALGSGAVRDCSTPGRDVNRRWRDGQRAGGIDASGKVRYRLHAP